MSDKDRLIADFQACTGIEDFAVALKFLEESGWDLINAVNNAMTVPSGFEVIEGSNNPQNNNPHSSLEDVSFQTFPPVAPTSSHRLYSQENYSSLTGPKTLKFTIKNSDTSATIYILESQTVGNLKELIEKEFKVPFNDIYLTGWYNDVKVFNYTILSSLCLPPENELTLLPPASIPFVPKIVDKECTKSRECNSQASTSSPSDYNILLKNHILNVKNSSTNETFVLNVPGTKSFSDIKKMVAERSTVPEAKQKWFNFPKGFSDASLPLSESGLGRVVNLEFRVKTPTDSAKNGFTSRQHFMERPYADKPVPTVDLTSSQPSSDEDEDVSIEEFHDTTSGLAFLTEDQDMEQEFSSCSSLRRPQPMIQPNTVNIVEGQQHFVQEFTSRYGKTHPNFYIGTLGDALNASCNLPISERKLLAIYLHNDLSIFSNIFCSINLCYESIVSYLNANFVLWPWDVTDPQNKERFLEIASAKFGKSIESTIKHMQASEYPCLILLQKIRGQYEILNIFKGSTCIDDLMSILMQSVEMYQGNRQTFLNEELDRDRRELIKKEQDEAYRLSLLTDKAKKEARMKEFEQDQLIQRMKEEEDEFKMKEKEAIKKSLADNLPPEPPKNSPQEITTIKIRVPWIPANSSESNPTGVGTTYQRRFLADSPLQTLIDYVASLGFSPDDYAYMTYWPRADITNYDARATLKSLKIFPQELLTITERTLN